jgi:hypothetical protein
MQYPDCDSVKMFSDPPKGNGECSACHGGGFATFFDAVAKEFLRQERPGHVVIPAAGRATPSPVLTGNWRTRRFLAIQKGGLMPKAGSRSVPAAFAGRTDAAHEITDRLEGKLAQRIELDEFTRQL